MEPSHELAHKCLDLAAKIWDLHPEPCPGYTGNPYRQFGFVALVSFTVTPREYSAPPGRKLRCLIRVERAGNNEKIEYLLAGSGDSWDQAFAELQHDAAGRLRCSCPNHQTARTCPEP